MLVPRPRCPAPQQSAEGGGCAFAQGLAIAYILIFYVLHPVVMLHEAERCMSLATRTAGLTEINVCERPPRCRQECGSQRGV